ncbi:MAG: NAD(P)-binding protein [Elusimicrobiales bacterium]|jgi:protoporphyrinogen oxidase|nr:NAD(P)-binding protein [Elusimicrobiales bacterium]
MIRTDALIIGGGLAGLSAAMALKGRKKTFLAEREVRYGGLAATIRKGGFHFDYSGHLLHLRWPETTRLIMGALGANVRTLRRDARVFAHGRWTPYPFQANLAAMPPAVRSECVAGFLRALAAGGGAPGDGSETFDDWSRRVFGAGISRHFMLPYNAKLWQYPLDRLTTEWCAPFVPVPSPGDIIKGAYGPGASSIGYNAVFHYPRRGGIGALASALALKAGGTHLGIEVERVDLRARRARVRHFGEISFRRLINTAPLDEFVAMCADAPAEVRRAAARLRRNSVYVLNLGARGVRSDMHWGYFPGAAFPFYRAGIASNFSRRLAPDGQASFYIEIATDGRPLDLESAERACVKGLAACGLIRDSRQVTEKMWLKIPCAYVIYDADRARALPVIAGWLKERRARSIGRYGAWKYSFMEESVREGLEAGREILSGR